MSVMKAGALRGVTPAEGVAQNAVGGWSEGETSPANPRLPPTCVRKGKGERCVLYSGLGLNGAG
jgi:hypothetical protein